ncbi:bifunctional AP-4-A phosphorylase/ADP sulfurylase [Dipsacomyces acuminosporus]|nr:bifunctional AP-4-A phosphorylase/ADP sulfurylase [Dipsacomyces acuminosporus]
MKSAPTALDTLVHERYGSAVAQGALLFANSEIVEHKECGVDFEIRYAPALAKKPSSKPKEKQQSNDFVNPFLPFDRRLHVKSLGSTHQLLLNKYCIIPGHLLITTAEFEQQGEPLTEKDFAVVLDTTSNLSRRHIVFYNSGEESGASQPHKHLQILPMPSNMADPPTMTLWLESAPPCGQAYACDKLPFSHIGVRLNTASLSPASLLAAYSKALCELTRLYAKDISYNMVLTPSALMLFPRKQNSWQGIGINSLGYAGLMLCKTADELNLVKASSILSILTNAGYPVNSA